MSERRPWSARSRTRALTLAVAIMAGVLSAALWYSAETMVPSGSPVDPSAHIVDRVWDPRRLAAAVICVDVALVALALAFVRTRGAGPGADAETENAEGTGEEPRAADTFGPDERT